MRLGFLKPRVATSLGPAALALLALAAGSVGCDASGSRPGADVSGYELAFSTYLGGSGREDIRDLAFDAEGNLYAAGGSASADLHVTWRHCAGSNGKRASGLCGEPVSGVQPHDVVVAKYAPGGQLVWSARIGGGGYDRAYAIEVGAQGRVYLGGRAGPGFPTTPGVVQEHFGGDRSAGRAYGPQDGFVSVLSPDGAQLLWSTYFGGDDGSIVRDIDVDAHGAVFLAISRASRPSPHITAGAFQTRLAGESDGLVAKLSADGSRVIFASYLGGSGADGLEPSVRVDDAGSAYLAMGARSSDVPVTAGAYQPRLAGEVDIVLAKFSPDGSRLAYSTYFGGSGHEGSDTHYLSLLAGGEAVLTAGTNSPDLPVTRDAYQRVLAGQYDWFIARFSRDGSRLVASTYLGGSGSEIIQGSAVHPSGYVVVGGPTSSPDFPTTPDAIQLRFGGERDFGIAKLSSDLSRLLYATFVGGAADDIGRSLALDDRGTIGAIGNTRGRDWPTANPAQAALGGGLDGVVLRLVPANDTSAR